MHVLLVQPLPLQGGSRTRRTSATCASEMRLVADLGYDFASFYVGGGTPTILLDELAETIDLARELFPGDRGGLGRDEPQSPGPRAHRSSHGPRSATVVRRPELRRPPSAPDGPLRQVRHRRGGLRAPRVDGGHVPIVQRGHDLQLPEPDRRRAAARHRTGQGHGRQPDDLLPADGVPSPSPRTRRRRSATSTSNARPATTGSSPTHSHPTTSRQARGRSRATRTP